MNADDLHTKITTFSQWKRATKHAPHKPLLLLLALAAVRNDARRWIPYSIVEPELQKLLEEFGPPRPAARADYPFWRLQTDVIWTVRDADRILDAHFLSRCPTTYGRRLGW